MSKIAIFIRAFLASIDENLILLFTLSKYNTEIRVETGNFREIFINLHEFSPRKTRKMQFVHEFSADKIQKKLMDIL